MCKEGQYRLKTVKQPLIQQILILIYSSYYLS